MIIRPPSKNVLHHDLLHREFYVTKIDIRNNLGREIQGKVRNFGDSDWSDYSCPYRTWKEVWVEKVSPISADKMKIG